MPFSLKNAASGGAGKRANPYAAESESPAKKSATKAPAASSLVPRHIFLLMYNWNRCMGWFQVMMESAPRANNRPQRLPASAPLDVVIYKVTTQASDCWDQFTPADGAHLWQIQLEHPARPSAIFNLRDSFQDFLKEAGDGIPASLDVLQQKAGIKLVLADRNDPDKAASFDNLNAAQARHICRLFRWALSNGASLSMSLAARTSPWRTFSCCWMTFSISKAKV